MRYVFLNASSTVVNVIVGDLTAAQQAFFLTEYRTLFGATEIVEITDPNIPIYMGGEYRDGEFLVPVQPTIVDGSATIIDTTQQEPLPDSQEPA